MRASDASLLFPLTRGDAFVLGRLACLRAFAITLAQSRRRLGDAHAASDLAERIHASAHDILLQLFAVGQEHGVEIRTVDQAVAACSTGTLGLYPAYITGSLVESEWFLDLARTAYANHELGGFARSAGEAIRARAASQLDGQSNGDLRRHEWVPRDAHLDAPDSPAALYMLTTPVGEATLWVTRLHQTVVEQAAAAYFVPVPEAAVASRPH